ncbi:hypothetical protein JOE23_002774 [Amphibacillus cookii]|nr:hypothetical protein [Amphibacillus cookii]
MCRFVTYSHSLAAGTASGLQDVGELDVVTRGDRFSLTFHRKAKSALLNGSLARARTATLAPPKRFVPARVSHISSAISIIRFNKINANNPFVKLTDHSHLILFLLFLS